MEKTEKGQKCPHCDKDLVKWKVSLTPFTEWETDHMYICFSNECPYYKRSFETMEKQGILGFAYRLMYDPLRKVYQPIPIPAINVEKDNIAEQVHSIMEIGNQLGKQYG